MALAERLAFAGRDVSLVAEHSPPSRMSTACSVRCHRQRTSTTAPMDATRASPPPARGSPVWSDGMQPTLPIMCGTILLPHLAELQLRRLHDAAIHILSRRRHARLPPIVGCGVGRFVAERLAARMGLAYRDLAELVPASGGDNGYWVSSCAPAVTLACLTWTKFRK